MPKEESEADKLRRRESFLKSVARKTEASPLYAALQADGAEIELRPIPHRHQAYWNATKDHLYGSGEAVLTDLGKHRFTNRKPWMAAKSLARNAVKFAPPSMSAHMKESLDKMDETRGILDVQGYADKLGRYIPGKMPGTVSKAGAEMMYHALVDTFNEMNNPMRAMKVVKFEDIDLWISQIKPNRNSGNPDYTPLSKEQLVSEYWPVLRETLKEIVINGDMTATLPPYSDNIYASFHRSPDRPIHGAGVFDKLIGAFLNYHLVEALAGNSTIAWENLDDMFVNIAEAMSTAESTMHDDFKAYDGHFGLETNSLIRQAFLDSEFLMEHRELRHAFEWFCNRLVAEDTLLQLSPTHAMKMRPSLFSGTPVTQFWGCVFHDAFYRVLRDVYSMSIIFWRELSDDGMAVMEDDAATVRRQVSEIVKPFAESIGMEINEPKSYVADLSVETKMFEHAEHTTHDMGPFLQFYPQRDPAASFGNVPRRLWSLHERERDSTEASRMTMLAQHAPGLTKHKLGTDRKQVANWVSDLHRSLDVISTIRPSYPRIREVLVWFAKVYPNFRKKFSKLYREASPGLWDERSLMAGGTREGGSSKWVVDYYNEWLTEGVAPRRVA